MIFEIKIILLLSFVFGFRTFKYGLSKTWINHNIIICQELFRDSIEYYFNQSLFDSDFADAVSKPIPQWYNESQIQQELLSIEIKNNRMKIIMELKNKYEVSKDVKREKKERQSNFKKLPGFFEVFPELQLFKWPIWSRNKRGNTIPCSIDTDCTFPQACCYHPIIPGDKFCCTGWAKRIMIPAYVYQEIQRID